MSLRHQIAANESWAHTVDRSARTQAARDAFRAKFEDQVDPDRVMDPQTRAKAVDSAIKAHYQRLALKSVEARRRRAA